MAKVGVTPWAKRKIAGIVDEEIRYMGQVNADKISLKELRQVEGRLIKGMRIAHDNKNLATDWIVRGGTWGVLGSKQTWNLFSQKMGHVLNASKRLGNKLKGGAKLAAGPGVDVVDISTRMNELRSELSQMITEKQAEIQKNSPRIQVMDYYLKYIKDQLDRAQALTRNLRHQKQKARHAKRQVAKLVKDETLELADMRKIFAKLAKQMDAAHTQSTFEEIVNEIPKPKKSK